MDTITEALNCPKRIGPNRRRNGWVDFEVSKRIQIISELRAAVHADGIAADPPSIIGCQESYNATDIVGLGQALERLHTQRDVPTRVCLDEARHVRGDDALSLTRSRVHPVGAHVPPAATRWALWFSRRTPRTRCNVS
jgi:hypothetical protein